jgi:2-polyprenyl-3-methyl-5-hydroxy-6-metoxy-1,4-benzoquinol methylase
VTSTKLHNAHSTYTLDQAWHAERDRLNSLTALYDRPTIELCRHLGLAPGWRCAEVGAGTGSIAEQLAGEVGPTGLVLAVDVDTRFVEPLQSDVLAVAQIDVTDTDLPSGPFDLIHARLVLEHLPSRDDVLARLSSQLAPGGWLLIEDFDWATATVTDPPSALGAKVARACQTMFTQHGYAADYGRRLPRALEAVGLTDIRTRAEAQTVRANHRLGLPQWELLVAQLAPAMLDQRLVSPSEIDEFTQLCHDGDTLFFAPIMVSSAGQKSAD